MGKSLKEFLEEIPSGWKGHEDFVIWLVKYTKPEIIVDRLVAESNPSVLIEPKWSLNKQAAISEIIKHFKSRKSYQGKLYNH